jgi:hypothetical protein
VERWRTTAVERKGMERIRVRLNPTLFEGGPLEGQSFELPPGTIEIAVAGPVPGQERYEVVVRHDGVFAVWVEHVPPLTH